MATLYSALLFEQSNIGSTIEVFLDPSYLWVVRCIDVFFPPETVAITLQIYGSVSGATFFAVNAATGSQPNGPTTWRGRQVFAPPADGPTLTVVGGSSIGDGPDCRISGYKLYTP